MNIYTPDELNIFKVVGESGSMLLHFYSDVAYNMTGFNITFTMDSCPSNHYQNTCSGRGSCNYTSGLCNCDRDFKGLGCERVACPENCGLDEGRGQVLTQKCHKTSCDNFIFSVLVKLRGGVSAPAAGEVKAVDRKQR